MSEDITRPIIGIENRTAQEVFDIMCDRIRLAGYPAPSTQMLGSGDRIADAIEACDWSGSPIGNKEILKAAVRELRSLQAWQRGAVSCREAEEARIDEYRRAALATATEGSGE
jgi:hypothetical protein